MDRYYLKQAMEKAGVRPQQALDGPLAFTCDDHRYTVCANAEGFTVRDDFLRPSRFTWAEWTTITAPECPWCRCPMEVGLIVGGGSEMWWKPHRRAERRDCQLISDGIFKDACIRVWRCASCEKMVIDYKDGACDLTRSASR